MDAQHDLSGAEKKSSGAEKMSSGAKKKSSGAKKKSSGAKKKSNGAKKETIGAEEDPSGAEKKTRGKSLRPPFPDARGEWVRRKNFTGRKTFGHFTCFECNKDWTSAHAFKAYAQRCKACSENAFPRFLWQNDKDHERAEGKRPDQKPHLNHLCGACKAGVCKSLRDLQI